MCGFILFCYFVDLMKQIPPAPDDPPAPAAGPVSHPPPAAAAAIDKPITKGDLVQQCAGCLIMGLIFGAIFYSAIDEHVNKINSRTNLANCTAVESRLLRDDEESDVWLDSFTGIRFSTPQSGSVNFGKKISTCYENWVRFKGFGDAQRVRVSLVPQFSGKCQEKSDYLREITETSGYTGLVQLQFEPEHCTKYKTGYWAAEMCLRLDMLNSNGCSIMHIFSKRAYEVEVDCPCLVDQRQRDQNKKTWVPPFRVNKM